MPTACALWRSPLFQQEAAASPFYVVALAPALTLSRGSALFLFSFRTFTLCCPPGSNFSFCALDKQHGRNSSSDADEDEHWIDNGNQQHQNTQNRKHYSHKDVKPKTVPAGLRLNIVKTSRFSALGHIADASTRNREGRPGFSVCHFADANALHSNAG